MTGKFRIGLTRDFLGPDGNVKMGDIGLGVLDGQENVEYEFLAEDTRELRPDQVKDYDALLVLVPRVSTATLEGCDRLAVVARFGVGYDSVDVPACTRNGVLLTITPDGVRRPVAVGAITFLLTLSQDVLLKDRVSRKGTWQRDLTRTGVGLVGRTLGIVGLGNIGSEVCRLAQSFGLKVVASDPYASSGHADALGASLVCLDTLLATADFVCICCALTDETRGLIDVEKLRMMKSEAFLVNVARGPIIDQPALTQALQEKWIRGAAIDVFEREPVDPDDPILQLDNIIVTPHAICLTDQCVFDNGSSALKSILDVANGRIPENVVNREAIESPIFQTKLERWMKQGGKK